ncbi:MAG: glycosyltransferase family 1 protein, partial [Candidatus Kapaibacterium sp.]
MNQRKCIAVNTRFLINQRLEGIGFFTFESMKRIVLSHPECDFYFLFDRKYSQEFIFAKNVTPVI